MQRWGNPLYVFNDFSSDHIRGFFQLALPAEHQYKHTITQHSPEKPFPHVELLIHDVKDRWSNIALKPVSINTNKRLWVYIYSWMCSSSWWCSWEVLVERPWLVLVFVVCVQSLCVHCKTFRCKFTVKYWQLGCQPHTVFLQDYYCKQHLQFCTVFTKYSIILLYIFFYSIRRYYLQGIL